MIRFRKSLSKPITLGCVALAAKYIGPERDSQHGRDIGACDFWPMTGLHARITKLNIRVISRRLNSPFSSFT
jgi:hypothetical protein